MPVNDKEFFASFDASIFETEELADQIFRKTALQMVTDTIKATPVDTGRLRNNWYTNIGSPSTETTDQVDKGGDGAIYRSLTELNKFDMKKHSAIYISNNLPYAERIEYGYSMQAPNGMLRKAIAKFNLTLERIAREVKK